MVDPATGMPIQPGMEQSTAGMDLGQPIMDPEIDASSIEPSSKVAEMPKGGEI